LTAVVTGVLAFTVYFFTLAPSVAHVDSGEVAAACWTFGVAHPPGYPLYVLLAGVWAHAVPFGTVIERLNIFSALSSAAGIVFLVMALQVLLGATRAAAAPSEGDDDDASVTMSGSGARHFAAAVGGLVIALSLSWWTVSLLTDVYAMAMCFFALNLWLWTSVFFDITIDSRKRMRRGIVASLCAGLALSVHPMNTVLLPVLLLLYLRHYRMHGAGLRRFLIALPYFLLGLTPYAFLIVRAAAGAEVNWADPSTFQRFVDHVSAAQFRQLFFGSWSLLELQVRFLIDRFPQDVAYPLLPLLLVGIVSLFRRNGTAAWMALLLVATGAAWAINVPLLDVAPHFLPMLLGVVVFLAAGVHALASSPRRWLSFAGTLYVLGALGLHGAAGYRNADLSEDHVAEDYTRNIFESLRPQSLLFSDEWHVFLSPAMYFQFAEHARPDVLIIDTRLSRRPWYLAQLQKRAASAVAPARREIDAYLALLDAKSRGAAVRADSLTALHSALLARIIDANLEKRPVCLTAAMDALIPSGCEAVPEGMVLRLYPVAKSPSPEEPVWDAFIARRPARSTEYDRLVEGRYFRMLARRGYWLYAKDRQRQADGYFVRASAFRQFEATPRWHEWKIAMEALHSSF
jgi:hypothetical protein